jgi:hypothetical protein
MNISLESCGLSKDKGLLEANPNTKLMYTMSCAVNLGDRGKKRGFKRSRRREKEREKSFTC